MKFIRPFWKIFLAALTLLGVFWLPKDIQDYEDAAEPWKKALAMVDQNTALWAFSIILFCWLCWVDGRRSYEKWKRNRVAKPKPETENDRRLKGRIVGAGKHYYVPATDALNEALRISAYVIKDAIDHPFNFLVWQSQSQLNSYDAKFRRLFDRPDQASRLGEMWSRLHCARR